MPGIWQVRLSEALAIQGRPLDEQQIWAILIQAVQSLQDYLCRGNEFYKWVLFVYFYEARKLSIFFRM